MVKAGIKYYLLIIIPILVFCCSDEPNQPPILVILASPTSGNAPLAVQFSAEASDPDNNQLTFEWDFGDGSSKSDEKNPVHTYADAGIFTATCIVTDNGRPPKSAIKIAVVTVSAPTPVLNAIKPAWKVTHMPVFTLNVTGVNFIPSSRIVFNEKEKTTEFVSATELRCRIKAEDTDVFPRGSTYVKGVGLSLKNEELLPVIVRNPSPGGDSQPLDFTVHSGHTFSSPELICTDSDSIFKLLKTRYLYFIYKQSSGNNWRIMVSKDDGKTWLQSHEIPYAHSCDDLKYSLTADSSGILYYANIIGMADIYLTTSSDDGATWSENKLISLGTPENTICSYSAQNLNIIALNDDTLNVIWMEHSVECDGSYNYYIYSTDHGNTWSKRKKTPIAESTNTYYPILLGNGYGTLHYLFYMGTSYENPPGPYYMYSTNQGINWSNPVLIQAPSTLSPKIPFPGYNDYLYLPYITSIRYFASLGAQVSKDYGQSWDPIKPFGDLNYEEGLGDVSFVPDTANNLNVFWVRGWGVPNIAVYYSRLIDLNAGWDPYPAITISPNGYKSYRDSYAIDDEGNLYIVCQSNSKPNQIYFIRSERDE